MERFKKGLRRGVRMGGVLLLLFARPGIGWAAESDSLMTLADALQHSLEQNFSLKKMGNQVTGAEIDQAQQQANFWPDLKASLSAAKQFDRQGDPLSGEIVNDESRSLRAELSSNVNLFNGFADIAALEESRLNLSASQRQLHRQRESIEYETLSLYLQTIQDQEIITVELANLEAQQNQLAQISEFYSAGKRSISDVLQQRTDIADAELRVLQAQQNYELSFLRLMQVMGQSFTKRYSLETPPTEWFSFDPEEIQVDSMIVWAQRARGDLIAQRTQVQAAEQQVRIAQAGFWPTLNLSVGSGSSYQSGRSAWSFSDQIADVNPFASASLSLSIPFFDNYRHRNAVEKARLQRTNSEIDLRDAELTVQFEIHQAVVEVQSALKQRQAAQAKLEAAHEALQVATERYAVHAATFIELSQVRASERSAANSRVQAEYTVAIKWFALHYAVGNLENTLNELHLLKRVE